MYCLHSLLSTILIKIIRGITRAQGCNFFNNSRIILNYFEIICIYQTIFLFYLVLSWPISAFHGLSGAIGAYPSIYGYFWLFFMLYLAVFGYLRLYLAIRVQVEAGESRVLLFETFWFFLPHSAPSGTLGRAENLASSSLQDGARKWLDFPKEQPTTHRKHRKFNI